MDSAVSDDAADSRRSVLFHRFLLPAEPDVHPTMVVADDSSLYDRARVVPSGSMGETEGKDEGRGKRTKDKG